MFLKTITLVYLYSIHSPDYIKRRLELAVLPVECHTCRDTLHFLVTGFHHLGIGLATPALELVVVPATQQLRPGLQKRI